MVRRTILSTMVLALCATCSFLGGQTMSSTPPDQKTPLIVLLGAPGSGKGTQASAIVKEFGVVHISTGDMFRYHIKNLTPIGKKAKEYMDVGQLVPDDVVIQMLRQRFQEPNIAKGLLLDGFPRTLVQAEALDALVKDQYQVITIFLEVSDNTVLERLTGRRYCPECNSIYHVSLNPPKQKGICDKCGHALATRDDDTEKTVRERLTVFHQQIGPLKEFYDNKGILEEIDGELEPNEAAQICIKVIREHLKT